MCPYHSTPNYIPHNRSNKQKYEPTSENEIELISKGEDYDLNELQSEELETDSNLEELNNTMPDELLSSAENS